MKVFENAASVDSTGERIIGGQETGSHACYLVYGVVRPGEEGRTLRPGHGHEEIVLLVSGSLACSGAFSGELRQGQAVYLQDDETVAVRNLSGQEAVYVISGGHSGHEHH
jgi:hypothetical protein